MSLDTFCDYELPKVAATKKKPAPKKKAPAKKKPGGDGPRTMAVPERPDADDYEAPTEDIPDED